MTGQEVNIAGLTLQGAQTELGGMLVRAIKNEMALKQIKQLHTLDRTGFDCKCGEINCPTRIILNTVDLD